MADPNPDLQSQQTEALKNLEEKAKALAERFQKIDQTDEIFKANSDVFDKLIKKLQTKGTTQKDITYQTNLLQKNLIASKKIITDDLKTISRDLENKIATASPENKAQFQEKLKELNANISSLDTKLTDSIKTKIESVKKAGNNVEAVKKIKAAGFEKDVQEQLEQTQATAATVTSDIVMDTIAPDIIEQLKELTKEDGNVSGTGIGKSLIGAPILYAAFKKRLKGIGIDSPFSAVSGAVSESVMYGKNAGEIAQGGLLQAKSLLSTFENLTKVLTSVPLRIMDFTVKKGLEIKKDNFDFLNKLEEMQNTFSGKSGIGKNFQELNDSLKETRRLAYVTGYENEGRTTLYGMLGDDLIRAQIEETGQIIKAMGPYAEMMSESITRNIKEADARVSDYYYKAKKLMNLSEDDILSLTNQAVALGKSFPDVFHEISKATSDAAKKFNLDFKLMATDVLTLRKNITDFAHKSADELATVVANVKRMGVSMNDAMAVFSRVDSFETAATTAAQLNQAFGMVIDSMDLLRAESPDEILQQYKDAFAMSGKSFETMNRFERSLILQQTGLSDQAARAIFSLENAGKTYEEVMATVNQKDPTAEQIEHMAEMDHAIQRNYQVMSDYNGMMNMTAKIMNEKLFKESKAVQQSFVAMADSVQKVNHELGQMNVFGENQALDKGIKVFTKKVDEINDKMVKDKNALLNPIKKTVEESGNLIQGIADNDKEKMQKSLDTIAQTGAEMQERALNIGTKIGLDTAGVIIRITETGIETIKKTQAESVQRTLSAVITPENFEKVQEIQTDLTQTNDYLKKQAVNAINIGTSLPQIYTELKGIISDDQIDGQQKMMKSIELLQNKFSEFQTKPQMPPTTTQTTPTTVQIPTSEINNNNQQNSNNNQNNELRQSIQNLSTSVENLKDRPIFVTVNLDSDKLGDKLVKSDLALKLTNANKAQGASTLKPSTLNIRDGQQPVSSVSPFSQ